MRATDTYVALMGVVSGFGAVVLWRAGTPWGVVLTVALLGVTLLVVAITKRARTADVLLVGERFGRPRYDIRQQIEDRGFGLRTCSGPGAHACPVLDGEECPVRGLHVRVMLVGDAAGAPCGDTFNIPSEVL